MGVTICIDMGGTRIKIGLVEKGQLIADANIPAESSTSLQKRLFEIENVVDDLLTETNSKPAGVGIAFPDIVDSEKMKILAKYIKYPDAREVDLTRWAMNKWGIRLALENDARAALVGEWQYGAGKGNENLVLMTLGTGVGTAAMIQGELLKGKHFLAGILGGHVTLNFDGDPCNCGNIGCLETEASTWALGEKIKRSTGYKESQLFHEKSLNFHSLFTVASVGDALAVKIRDNCIRAWALGTINLIHAYDPEKVVIGGGVMKSKDVIIPEIISMVNKHAWIEKDSVEIVAAQQVDYAGILGMDYLVRELIKQ